MKRAAYLDERIGSTIGDLYEAAADPEHWSAALDSLADLLGGTAGLYFLWEPRVETAPFAAHLGFDEAFEKPYLEHYAAIDPRRRVVDRLPVGTAFMCHEHLGEDFVRRDEVYQDLLIPAGARWIVGAQLLRDAEQTAYVCVNRNHRKEPFAGESAKLFERLIPHLQRAAQLQLRLRRIAIEREATVGTLDQLAFGVILVDGGLRARAANAAAETILRAGDGLSLHRGRLAAARPTETRALEALLAGAVRTGRGEGLHPGGAMALPRPSGKRSLAVTVAPLPRRPGVLLRDAGDARPVAVLFVADPERRPTEPARRIRQLYRLTQREAQLVGILIAGRSLESAADEMGVTRESARGYLKRIFEKTRTGRQGELVALVLRGLTPTL